MLGHAPLSGAPIAASTQVVSGAITGVMAATEAALDQFASVGSQPQGRSLRKKRLDRSLTDRETVRADVERHQARIAQIEQEDEAILAVLVAATKVLGGPALWRQ